MYTESNPFRLASDSTKNIDRSETTHRKINLTK